MGPRGHMSPGVRVCVCVTCVHLPHILLFRKGLGAPSWESRSGEILKRWIIFTGIWRPLAADPGWINSILVMVGKGVLVSIISGSSWIPSLLQGGTVQVHVLCSCASALVSLCMCHLHTAVGRGLSASGEVWVGIVKAPWG